MTKLLRMNEVEHFVAEQVVPAIPHHLCENQLVDEIPEMLNSIFNRGEVRAGRLFDNNGELVIEPLGADHLTEHKASPLDSYIVRIDIIINRGTKEHQILRGIDKEVGEQLRLW